MPRKGENIYKRKDGRWEARYIAFYDDKGRAHYKSLYAKSYADAKRKKQKAVCHDSIQENKLSVKTCSSFGEACMYWLEHVKHQIRESSYVKYRGMLDAYVIPVLGSVHLQQIHSGLMEQYFLGLSEHGKTDGTRLSAKSVSDIKSVVKMVLLFSMREGWINECRIDHIVIKQEKHPIRVLEKEEQILLEKYLMTEFSNLHMGIYLSLYTGIRLGELCALRWVKVDLEARIIIIDKTMMRIKDYANTSEKRTKVIETLPKSSCAVREIPIPEFLIHLLREKSIGMTGQEYLLTGKADKFMEPRLVEYHFHKIIEYVGIKKANFHCLRHTFATRCIEVGFDVKTLSVILGHAAIHITMNRYVHPTMDMKRSNMEKLGACLEQMQYSFPVNECGQDFL